MGPRVPGLLAAVCPKCRAVAVPALLFGGPWATALSVEGSGSDIVVLGGPGQGTATGGFGQDVLCSAGPGPTGPTGGGGDLDVFLWSRGADGTDRNPLDVYVDPAEHWPGA